MEVYFIIIIRTLYGTLENKAGSLAALHCSPCVKCGNVLGRSNYYPFNKIRTFTAQRSRRAGRQCQVLTGGFSILQHWGNSLDCINHLSIAIQIKFDKEGNVTSFVSKGYDFPDYLLILDYRNLNLELALQRPGFPNCWRWAACHLLQHRIDNLQARLQELQPKILETLESLVDLKMLSVDRSKLHILLQNSKNLPEQETDIKVFKEFLLEILDEEELTEELCLTMWTDPQVFEESSLGIDHAEEMELLLENYYRQAEDLANTARELKVLIDDSESVIFINLDRLVLQQQKRKLDELRLKDRISFGTADLYACSIGNVTLLKTAVCFEIFFSISH